MASLDKTHDTTCASKVTEERPIKDVLATAIADYEFFQKIQWCRTILNDPEFIVRVYSREYKESTEDALFNRTFKTEDTIQAWLSLHSRPAQDAARVDEVHTLLHLGSGLNGHPRICHGGIVATIMDENMGVLLAVNKNLGNLQFQGNTVTAFLNTRYLKPVTTPQVVLVTASFAKVEGRKYFLQASIVNGEGEVLAEADSLFIKLKEQF